jgi:hypothetical protein
MIPESLINKIIQEKLLGIIPDKYLARRYKISIFSIWCLRKKLGIKRARIHLLSGNHQNYQRKINLEELKPLLGKEKDIRIAERFKVSRERIRQIRTMFGIKRFKGKGK